MQNEVTYMIDRVHTTRGLPSPPQFVRQRLAAAAEQLNRATDLAAYTETANEALFKLVSILYEPAADGQWANMDPATGRILVPAPWGSSGWKHWGMRHWEAVVLSKVLRNRFNDPKHMALFEYDRDTTCWCVCTPNFPTGKEARWYLKTYPITPQEWRYFSDAYHAQQAKRKRKK